VIIVSDTTPLSELAKVGKIELLRDIFGTIGILLVAKQKGLTSSIKDILDALIAEGKHISSRLYEEALAAAHEL
jgi:predicted nucleic acid-binding protein